MVLGGRVSGLRGLEKTRRLRSWRAPPETRPGT